MKAVVYTKYGSPDVLELKEVEKPTPKDSEVLVKIQAVSVNAADLHLLNGKPFLLRLMGFGLLKPKRPILGADIAGRVEAIGKAVKQFKVGDAVFGDISGAGFGGFAEYVAVTENVLTLKPNNLSFEQAAAVPMAACTALQGLRTKGQIKPGQTVLINGGSGGVGTFAVQIAKALGAKVTAVASPRHLNTLRSLGADYFIDYTKEDFTRSGQQYDLILGANGYQPISAYKRALSPKGTYVMSGGSNAQMFQAMLYGPWLSLFGGKKLSSLMAKPNLEDLAFISQLLEIGKITPIIDRCYPLNEATKALSYLSEGHASGKVIICVE